MLLLNCSQWQSFSKLKFLSVLAAVNSLQQTEPPSVAIVDLFPDGGPQGEIQEYALLEDGLVN